MQLSDADIGKQFKRRDGKVITLRRNGGYSEDYPYQAKGESWTYNTEGRWRRSEEDFKDLVERVEPSADCVFEVKESPRQGNAIQNVLRKLPSMAGERKTLPIMTGVLDYFPLAMAEVARISKQGNDQHNPGQPLHWSRGVSSDHSDCVVRHLVERGTTDTDGMRHTAKAAWRALALLQEEMEAEAGWKPAVKPLPSVTPLTSKMLIAEGEKAKGSINISGGGRSA